ncbi:MAG: hypothetical protein ACLQNG_17945 [Acidimicrobiales bacterium]
MALAFKTLHDTDIASFCAGTDDAGDLAAQLARSPSVPRVPSGPGWPSARPGRSWLATAGGGADRIVADADRANTPMRAAFRRAGYREFRGRDDYLWRRSPL